MSGNLWQQGRQTLYKSTAHWHKQINLWISERDESRFMNYIPEISKLNELY